MSFANPLLLWGALFGSIPIIIHILSRRRFKVMRWAATDFLLEALADRSRSVKLEDLILLALRVLVLVIASLLVARPLLTTTASEFAAGSTDTVIILDTSYSMGTNVGGETRLQIARQQAHRVLEGLPKRGRAAVVYAGGEARSATVGLVTDRALVGRAIDEATVAATSADMASAMDVAIEMLSGSTAPSRRVYLMTDGQRRTFRDQAETLREVVSHADASVGFVVMTVPNDAVANYAVVDLAITSRALRVGSPARFDATIVGYGPAADDVGMELWIDGRKVAREKASLAEDEPVRFEHTFTMAGLFAVEVRLDPDAVELDNHRYVCAIVRDAIDVVVVVPDGMTGNAASPRLYLASALNDEAGEDGSAGLAPFDVRPAVSRDRLAEVLTRHPPDVVVLADPGGLPSDAERALSAWSAAGGAVLVTSGPNAIETLGVMRTGKVGIGQWMRDLTFTMPDPDAADAEPLQLDVADAARVAAGFANEPVVDLASPGVPDVLAAMRVFQAVNVEEAAETTWTKVLRLTDGREALLVKQAGVAETGRGVYAGLRVGLMTFGFDAAWSDLVYRPAMVPLMHDVLTWLAMPRLMAIDMEPGGMWMPVLPSDPDDLKILMPGETTLAAKGFYEPIEGVGRRLQFDRTAAPGLYRLIGFDDDATLADARRVMTVNLDPVESDPAIVDAAVIEALFPSGRCQVVRAAADGASGQLARMTGGEAWHWAALAVLIFLVIETACAFLFCISKRRSGSLSAGGRA